MTLDEIIRSLEDQAQDKDSLADGDPESIFTEDATVLREAAKLLKAYQRTGLTAADIQETVDLLNDTIRPDDLPAELKSWAERCTWHVKKCAVLHEEAAALEKKNAELAAELAAAKTDIAAILWLEGQCHYCKFAQKVEHSGASRLTCKLGSGAECRPEWRGTGEAKS